MNTTEATNLQITGKEFYHAAAAVSAAKDQLNTSSSGYGCNFFALRAEDAKTAIGSLERLIADRQEQIADAKKRLTWYRLMVQGGGCEAYMNEAVTAAQDHIR
jgi:hypothetical protein